MDPPPPTPSSPDLAPSTDGPRPANGSQLAWSAYPGAFPIPKDELLETFERTVDEGERRTHRT